MKNKVVDKLAALKQNGVVKYDGMYYVVHKGVAVRECVKYVDAVLIEMAYGLEVQLYYGGKEEDDQENKK